MFPDLTPLDPQQRELLQKGLGSLRPEQLVWLSGYLSGRASTFLPESDQGILPTGAPTNEVLEAGAALAAGEGISANAMLGAAGLGAATAGVVAASATVKPTELLVLYGTESGNAEGLADKLTKTTKKKGFKPTVKNMNELSPADLKKHENILTIVSTWGDGEPPESATEFFEGFMKEDLDLKGVNFSVLALGDTSYEKFCQTGKDIDARFEALGATRSSMISSPQPHLESRRQQLLITGLHTLLRNQLHQHTTKTPLSPLKSLQILISTGLALLRKHFT